MVYDMNKDQKYYQAHKAEVLARNNAYRNRVLQEIRDLKAEAGCQECGETDWRCLDFHHTDPEQKVRSVSSMRGLSLKRVMEEVNKCLVLCSNCHRKQHAPEA